MAADSWIRLTHRPQWRFAFLAGPGALFIVIALLLPLLTIVVFSFWRTESYEIYADWNLDNYRLLLGEAAYRVFFLRSLITSVLVSLACLVLAWPIAYFIACCWCCCWRRRSSPASSCGSPACRPCSAPSG
jgi:ABC-type spermidine/putrescine transport system permease subunit I